MSCVLVLHVANKLIMCGLKIQVQVTSVVKHANAGKIISEEHGRETVSLA